MSAPAPPDSSESDSVRGPMADAWSISSSGGFLEKILQAQGMENGRLDLARDEIADSVPEFDLLRRELMIVHGLPGFRRLAQRPR